MVDHRPDEDLADTAPPPINLAAGTTAGSLTARLDAWLADARVEGSADARARERWLHAAAEGDATFGGVLLDLAERRTDIAVSTSGRRRHHGRVEVIGTDFLSLRAPAGPEVLLALSTITAVRTVPRADPSVGERLVTTELRLAEVLSELAVERARVLLVPLNGTDIVAGELRAVGRDVVTVRTDGDAPAITYMPLRAIAEVTLAW
jgi:hypothetical protein